MSDEYLWDGSGEPDPEVEHLEQLLGNLCYEPTALKMPVPLGRPVHRQRQWNWQHLAIAAAFVLTVLAAGLWLHLQRYDNNETNHSAIAVTERGREEHRQKSEQEEFPTVNHFEPESGSEDQIATGRSAGNSPDQKIHRMLRDNRRAMFKPHTRAGRVLSFHSAATVDSGSLLDQRTRDEGERAKAQLMLALHISSNKLNVAQKKVQENSNHEPRS